MNIYDQAFIVKIYCGNILCKRLSIFTKKLHRMYTSLGSKYTSAFWKLFWTFYFFKLSYILRLLKSVISLTLLWRRPLSYRNQSIDLRSNSLNQFLYDHGLRHEWGKLPYFFQIKHGKHLIFKPFDLLNTIPLAKSKALVNNLLMSNPEHSPNYAFSK